MISVQATKTKIFVRTYMPSITSFNQGKKGKAEGKGCHNSCNSARTHLTATAASSWLRARGRGRVTRA